MTRRGWRNLAIWLGIALLLGAAVLPPLVNADRFAAGIRRSLERELGRAVEVGQVRVHLFPTPGFTVGNVVIGEDPAWGLEPVAYVTALYARPKLSSLWTGRLEFASLELSEPSVNLVRVTGSDGAARWNFEPLLARAVAARLPDIGIVDGRINFKSGDAKSVFYFTNTQASIDTPSGTGADWRVRFSGEPARTDRAAHGFGRLEGSGRWRPNGSLHLDLRLEKSAVAEMITLVSGGDVGVHGLCSARLRLAGKPDGLKIAGLLQIEDVHRWDMLPPHGGGWVLGLDGRIDLWRQRIELSVAPQGDQPPLLLRLRAWDYLSKPRWGIIATFQRTPLAPLVEVARHMGVPIPAGIAAKGEMAGALGYSGGGELAGCMRVSGAALGSPGAPAVSFEDAELVFDGPRVELRPTIAHAAGDDARIQAAYYWNTRLFDIAVGTDGMQIASGGSRAVLATAPLLQQISSGAWQGLLRCQRLPDGTLLWTGRAGLEDAQIAAPGFAEPVRLESAIVRLMGRRVAVENIEAQLGAVEWQGAYRYDPQLARPHWFRIAIPELSAGVAEDLLLPVLRRSRGFLARTLGIGSGLPPGWLAARRAEGTLRIGELEVGELKSQQVRAHVVWDGETVKLTGITARVLGGKVEATLAADLRASTPSYRLDYRLDDADWKGGTVSSEGALRTSGTGIQTLKNLRAEGSFGARRLELDPAAELDEITGTYQLTWRGGRPIFRFADLVASVGEARYSGKGASREDGALLVELSDGASQFRLTGTLEQLRLERVTRQ
jgi:hypothetical protein